MHSGRIRMSDAERESVLARLQTATVEGRLTLQEFGSRAERVYASRTWGEAAGLLDDLPGPPMAGPPMAGPRMAGPPMAGPPMVGAREVGARHGQALLALLLGVLALVSIVALPLGMAFGAAAVALGVVTLRDRRPPWARLTAVLAVVCGLVVVAGQVALILLLGLSWS